MRLSLKSLLLTLIVSTSCTTRKAMIQALPRTEFDGVSDKVPKMTELLKSKGIPITDLGLMKPLGPNGISQVNFHNAFVNAWLATIAYGSAKQIVDSLESAGIVDAPSARQAKLQAKRMSLYRTLYDSYSKESFLNLFEYKMAESAQQKNKIAFTMLPKLYAYLKEHDEFVESIERSLRYSLSSDTKIALRFDNSELQDVFDLLTSKSPVAFGMTRPRWAKNSQRLEIVFDELTSIVDERCDAILNEKLALKNKENEPMFKFTNRPTELLGKLSLVSQILEYELTHGSSLASSNDTNENSLFLFSGGRLTTDSNRLFEQASTQLLVIEHQNKQDVFFVFRGTSSINDLIDDFNPTLATDTLTQTGRLHGGFFNAFNQLLETQDKGLLKTTDKPSKEKIRLRPFIEDTLIRAKQNQKRIWITGHSLGGALAQIFAKFLMNPSDEDHDYSSLLAGVYTFGAPFVGDEKYAKALDSLNSKNLAKMIRFRYEQDLVSTINPNKLLNPKDQLFPDGQVLLLTESKKCILDTRLKQFEGQQKIEIFGPDMSQCGADSLDKNSGIYTKQHDFAGQVDNHNPANYVGHLADLRKN